MRHRDMHCWCGQSAAQLAPGSTGARAMPYVVADEPFDTKEALKDRCRTILAATVDGQPVADEATAFLLDLFRHHDEWDQKARGGVRKVTTQTTPHGTRCFVLRKHDGTEVDISFPHAIRLIRSTRSANLLPQRLRDFRSAARSAIRTQIFAYRDLNLDSSSNCPITGEPISRTNVVVDHVPPSTFDRVLFDFCAERSINPLEVAVRSEGGTVAVFQDQALLSGWQEYHARRAELRLLSKVGNLQLPKASIMWEKLWS